MFNNFQRDLKKLETVERALPFGMLGVWGNGLKAHARAKRLIIPHGSLYENLYL